MFDLYEATIIDYVYVNSWQNKNNFFYINVVQIFAFNLTGSDK